MNIGQDVIDTYWAHLRNREPWALVHPGQNCMPIGLHGDDGRYNKIGDRVVIVTLNFMLSREVSRPLHELADI